MTIEENRELVRRFVDEVFVGGNAAAVDELVAEDFVPHTWPYTGDGRADLRQAMDRVSMGLAEVEFTIEDMIGEGDRVAVRLATSATHVGDFMGLSPSGNRYTIGEIHIFRIRDGQIVEHWHQLDAIGLMRQLGAMPGG
jgi:steroid delta-isomerase-like uncharacterized protein